MGSYGSVLFETKTRDAKISLKATETTIQNLRGFNGCVVSIQKPVGANPCWPYSTASFFFCHTTYSLAKQTEVLPPPESKAFAKSRPQAQQPGNDGRVM